MKIVKIVVDSLLFIDTLLLLDTGFLGNLAHEILGVAMGILLLVHIGMHGSWIRNVSKNLKKVNPKTKIMYVVDILTMLVYGGAALFGILISHELFHMETGSNYQLVIAHIIFGRLAVVVMLLHIGMHLDRMFGGVKNRKIRISLYGIYSITAIWAASYSIYTLTHSFQWMAAFGAWP